MGEEDLLNNSWATMMAVAVNFQRELREEGVSAFLGMFRSSATNRGEELSGGIYRNGVLRTCGTAGDHVGYL